MTVTTQINKVNHAGTGIQTVFPYNFIVSNEEDMHVFIDDVELTSGWDIDNIGNPNGGYVYLDVAPADGTVVTLLRIVPMTQQIDYQPEEPFPSDTHEFGFDKLTQILQQLQEQAVRTIGLAPSTDGLTDTTLPDYEAGKLIGWCADSQALCNFDPPDCPPPFVDQKREMYGRIGADGSVIKKGGEVDFTISVTGTGKHRINFSEEVTETYVVVVGQAAGTTGWGATVFVTTEDSMGFNTECADDETGVANSREYTFHMVWRVA